MSRTGMERWRIGCTRQAYGRAGAAGPAGPAQACPAPKRTQCAMVSGCRRAPGAAAARPAQRQGAPRSAGAVGAPRLQRPHPGAAHVGRRDAERLGEEPRGVDRVAARAGDDHLVHLPVRAGRARTVANWAGVPVGSGAPAEGQVGQDPAGRPRRALPDRAAQWRRAS